MYIVCEKSKKNFENKLCDSKIEYFFDFSNVKSPILLLLLIDRLLYFRDAKTKLWSWKIKCKCYLFFFSVDGNVFIVLFVADSCKYFIWQSKVLLSFQWCGFSITGQIFILLSMALIHHFLLTLCSSADINYSYSELSPTHDACWWACSLFWSRVSLSWPCWPLTDSLCCQAGSELWSLLLSWDGRPAQFFFKGYIGLLVLFRFVFKTRSYYTVETDLRFTLWVRLGSSLCSFHLSLSAAHVALFLGFLRICHKNSHSVISVYQDSVCPHPHRHLLSVVLFIIAIIRDDIL